jgi:hypothetical protein
MSRKSLIRCLRWPAERTIQSWLLRVKGRYM